MHEPIRPAAWPAGNRACRRYTLYDGRPAGCMSIPGWGTYFTSFCYVPHRMLCDGVPVACVRPLHVVAHQQATAVLVRAIDANATTRQSESQRLQIAGVDRLHRLRHGIRTPRWLPERATAVRSIGGGADGRRGAGPGQSRLASRIGRVRFRQLVPARRRRPVRMWATPGADMGLGESLCGRGRPAAAT